jgi:AcrR family transcriptional regulator
MSARIDRRAARTRRALHQALIALILKKGYNAITVQELIDEADVARATFYAHYTSKDDLLRGGFKELRRGLAASHSTLAMFEHADGYRDVYRALVGGRGSHIALAELRRTLVELAREELATLAHDRGMSRELAVQFFAGAFLTVLTWWIESRSALAPHEVNAMFRRLVMGGIGPLVRP